MFTMNGIVLATRTPVVRKENGRCQVPPACRYIRAPKELCRERIFIEGLVLAIFEKELRRLLRMGYIHDSNITSIGKSRHLDRKSTRLNSSHLGISYAVFCLK